MDNVSVGGSIHRQIAEIWVRTAKRRGEAVAGQAVGRIWDVIGLLGQQPMAGVAGSCSGKPIRRFLAGDYGIYNALGAGKVRIRQVTHYKRKQAAYWNLPGE